MVAVVCLWFHRTFLSSLRSRLVLLVLLAVVPALGLILYTASEQRRADRIDAQEHTLRLVRLAANNQEQVIERTHQLLTTLAHLPPLRQGNSADCNQLMADLLKRYPAYANLGVLNPQGNIICNALPVRRSVNLADRPYFQRALKTKDITVGDYQIDRITGKATVNVAYPVLDQANQVQVIIIAALDLAWLNQLPIDIKLPEGSVFSVVDHTGKLIVRYPDPEKWLGKPIPEDAFHAMQQSEGEGTYEVKSLDGVPRIYAFVPLGPDKAHPDAYMRVGIPITRAYAEADRLLLRNLIALGGVTILALIAAWVGGDLFLLRHVELLVQTTQQLQQGNLSARAQLTCGSGELGQLARAFDELAETLEKREEAIATLNRTLQDRVDELQTLFEVIPIGILITDDPEFKQIRSNPAFAKILGIPTGSNASSTPTDLSQQPSYKILRNGQEIAPEETPLRYAAIHGVNVERAEVDILRGDGMLFNLYGYASPLFDEQGKTRGAIGAFLDITDRKQLDAEREKLLQQEQAAREQAEAANRIKDEFLAVLSHELRTPLNPILGWTRLLQTRNLDADRTKLALETIERNAKLQTQLIEDLLDISRILRGKLILNVCPVDLAAVIKAAIESVRLSAEAKSIQIETALEPVMRPIMGDPSRLQQVIWNLLSNAIKFTPAGGRVQVQLVQLEHPQTKSQKITPHDFAPNHFTPKAITPDYATSNHPASNHPASNHPIPNPVSSDILEHYPDTVRLPACAQITVTDTGKGIRPDFLPYVFDTFRQADGTTTRQFGGLGLGLAIVRRIVELHGGTVTAESQGEDLGATFTVQLPVLEMFTPSSQINPPSSFNTDLKNINVLLVDDDPDARELVAFLVQQAGACVTAVSSAQEALAACIQSPPDILLSDIGMPNMDGYSLMQQIRSLASHSRNIPAIALTAYATEKDQQQALTAGFQLHLAKPIDAEKLLGAIAQLVSTKRAD